MGIGETLVCDRLQRKNYLVPDILFIIFPQMNYIKKIDFAIQKLYCRPATHPDLIGIS